MTTVALDPLLATSRELICSLQDFSGAYPASPTFSAYRGYSWFRDGAFIADGVSSAGQVASPSAFLDWCARVVESQENRITAAVQAAGAGNPVPGEQMLPARFTLAGEPGTDDWWDFQLDGYGTWLWAAAEHTARHGLDLTQWQTAAALTVDYLLASWQRPCYDWWEEHAEQVHVSTLGCIVAGLRAAADSGLVTGSRADAAREGANAAMDVITSRGVARGHLTKWLGTDAVDASLAALIAPLGVIEAGSPLAAATTAAIEEQLCTEDGVHRFRADTFYGGGRWPLLSCFLGLAHARAGNTARAQELLAWAAATATEDGLLPEQVDGHLLAPQFRTEWIDRWGPVATPLLWSHAMVLRLATALSPTELKEDA